MVDTLVHMTVRFAARLNMNKSRNKKRLAGLGLAVVCIFLLLGCVLRTAGSCRRYHRNGGAICRYGDNQNRVDRTAIIQATSPAATLIIQFSPGHRKAVILSDEDLDALECSISHYREVHGYGPRKHPCQCNFPHRRHYRHYR